MLCLHQTLKLDNNNVASVEDDDAAAGTTTFTSPERQKMSSSNPSTPAASTTIPTPILGQIPSPTGGIHTFHTADLLRHRHHRQPQQHQTPPPSDSLSTVRAGHSLDDVDVAAGARELSGVGPFSGAVRCDGIDGAARSEPKSKWLYIVNVRGRGNIT